MAWSKTDTTIKAGNKNHMTVPSNFSATPAINAIEIEQWKVACEAAQLIMQRGVVGTTGTYTLTVSGTSNTGHPAGDTITITVTSA